jgi:hypothetical protein
MTTTAATWFYRTPENQSYLLAERVNSTFWEERLGGVWLNVVKSDSPILMAGGYNGADITMEWEPNKWMRLETWPAAPALAKGLSNILRRRANFRYETSDNRTVWEWWIGDASKRWQELQGKPIFRNPARLDGNV